MTNKWNTKIGGLYQFSPHSLDYNRMIYVFSGYPLNGEREFIETINVKDTFVVLEVESPPSFNTNLIVAKVLTQSGRIGWIEVHGPYLKLMSKK